MDTAQDLREIDFLNFKRTVNRVWLDEKQAAIIIKVKPGYIYDVPLSRCQTAEQVLSWIHQVGPGKTWGKEIISEFLEVLFYEAIPSEMWSGK